MATFAPQTSAAVAAAYDFSSFGKLVDVGGGNGALLIGILGANPRLRGIVFDQPHVAERARRKIAEAGLADALRGGGGRLLRVGARPARTPTCIKHVIHDWNDEQAIAILRNCRRAIAEGRSC